MKSDVALAAWLVFINGLYFGVTVSVVHEDIKRHDFNQAKWDAFALGTITVGFLLAQMFVEGVTP